MHFVEKNINFHKYETESKMENPTHSCRVTKPVLQFIQETQIKSKTVMRWTRDRKKRPFFVPFILSEGNFLTSVFYLNV